MKKLILIIAVLGITVPYAVLADGMFVPPPDRYAYETDQKAVIFYENNIETMVLSVQFFGNAYDFGWIVPTPAYPEISKSSDELFTALEEYTEVDYPYKVYVPSGGLGYAESGRQAVEVLETLNVDYYEVTILRASDSSALTDWLQENNYDFPDGADYLLDDYIDNNWFFTCFKIDTSALGYSKVSKELRTGHATPVQIRFASDQIVYPLKISGVMSQYDYKAKELIYDYYYQPPEEISILLYVFTDHRQTVPGYETDYAGWVTKDTISKFAYVDGKPWLSPGSDKYFLTRMHNTTSLAAIKDDVYFRQADNDELVNSEPLQDNSNVGFWVVVGIGLALSVGLIFVIIGIQIRKYN